MLSADNRSMNICIIAVPDAWLRRTYNDKATTSRQSRDRHRDIARG
jgi:hypothetical protein